jgi:hypothetical protein
MLRARLTLPALGRRALGASVLCACLLHAGRADALSGPLRASANRRYLVDAQGQPFFVHGEAGWASVTNLSEADALVYLDDLARRRFNAVMVELIEHKFSANPPANALGVKPFSGVAFQSTPSNAYLDHVRWFVRQAAQRGIVVFANPAYLGYNGGDEGWQQELEAAPLASARAWGTFVGAGLAQETNLVWHLFGDFDPPSHAKTNAVQAGLAAAAPSLTLFGHHFGRGTSSTEAREPWLTWSYVYPPPVGYMHVEVLAGYNAAPVVPQLLGEGYYEGDPQLPTTEDVRRQAWGALTSGAAGHFYGHRHIWGFGNGVERADWRGALDAPGRQQMAFVEAFFRKRSWWLLQPDQNNALVTAGRGALDSTSYVTAALASDRSWAVVYLPGRAGPVTIDRGRLAAKLNASWFDPRTGKVALMGAFPNSGSQQLTKPDANDWVLVLELAPSAAAPVPALPPAGKHSLLLFGMLLLAARRRPDRRMPRAPT